MADEQTTAPSAGEASDIVVRKAEGTGPISVMDAAKSLTQAWRNEQNPPPPAPPNSQPERAEPATAADQSADEADANPDEGHGETQEPEAAAKQPPIEPPVSWVTEEKERWQSIPRETQDYIAKREMARESLLTKSQKEAAEQLKGLTARERAMEQARLQFEQATQVAMQGLQAQLLGEFSDLINPATGMPDGEKTKKLAAEDWARYLRWDAHLKDLNDKVMAVREAEQRQAQEHTERFAKFAQEQDKLFVERNPEFADADKAAKMQAAAVSTLKDIGFTEDEIGKLWNGQLMLSLRDGRLQSLVADSVRYRNAHEAAKKAAAKPLPPVQRPGVAQPGNPSREAQIKSLQRQLSNATGMSAIRLAAQLRTLQNQASARR
jgi:hypothetical protein